MSVLYEILVATAFSLLLSPSGEVDNPDGVMEPSEEIVASADYERDASEAGNCETDNPD